MATYRIHHTKVRNTGVGITDKTRRYKAPYLCPVCETVHRFKTYHITFDNKGDALVSDAIHTRLTDMGAIGRDWSEIVTEGTEDNPPTQVVGLGRNAGGPVLSTPRKPPVHYDFEAGDRPPQRWVNGVPSKMPKRGRGRG